MYVLTSTPEIEPVTIDEARDHLRISGQTDEVTRLIKAARGPIERYLNRALITQTWDAYYDYWCDEFKLPYPPLQTVDSVKYINSSGTETTLAPSQYWVTNNEPAALVRRYDTVWPQLQLGRPQAIKIGVTVGYGDEVTDVPEEIRHAIKLLMTDLYENRGTVVLGAVSKIPNYIIDMIHSYRIYTF